MKAKKSDVWKVASRAFPNYDGRMFHVAIGGVLNLHDLNWGGGTRNQYAAVPLFDNGLTVLPHVSAPWLAWQEGKTITIPQGWAVVQYSIFCGKNMGLTIHVNTQDMAKVLPDGIKEVA